MNILFFIPFDTVVKNRWDGENVRTGGAAVSGTHQSFILAAEYVARHTQNTVYFLNNCNNISYNGVNYVDAQSRLPDIHTIVVPNWISHLPFSNHRTIKHFVVWYQCPGYTQQVHNIIGTLHNQARISFVHISNWSTQNVMAIFQNFFPLHKAPKIPNPLMTDCLPQNINFGNSRPNNTVFIALWERGADISERCWNKLKYESPGKWGDFLKLDYNGGSSTQKADKTAVFNTYSRARYFIYPLINSKNGMIHRDTFGCVVAEAIACGVEVLTYPVAALREYYDGLVTWIPFPPYTSTNTIDDPIPTPSVPQLGWESQDEHIIRLIKEIDANYDSRESLRRERAAKVIELFNPETCLKPWVTLME
jgi:hypothetical protein